MSREYIAYKPIRRFAPYPIHQQLFIRQQQEQERRRQSLLTAPSQIATTSRNFFETCGSRDNRFKYSEGFRSRVVQKIITFVDSYSSRVLSDATDSSEKCIICMYNYQENQILRKLGCGHKFHRVCIDEWLIKSYLCPVCRTDLMGTGKTSKGLSVLYHIWKKEEGESETIPKRLSLTPVDNRNSSIENNSDNLLENNKVRVPDNLSL